MLEPAQLTIVPATREQLQRAEANCYPQWGQPRGVPSVEVFHRIHSDLNSPDRPWAMVGRYQAWALVPRSDPGTLDILSHCETYRRVAYVQRPGGRVDEVATYGVASVFTPSDLRRRGYARHMLRLLHYVLSPRQHMPPFPREWGAPPTAYFGDAAFSVLYSDVGPDYYATCTKGLKEPGWVRVPYPHKIFKVPDRGNDDVLSDVQWLKVDDATILEATATDVLQREMKALPPPTVPRVAILPQGGWFREYPIRLEIFARNTGRDGSQYLKCLGARFGCGKDRPFVLYTVEPSETGNRMLLSHVQHPVTFDQVAAVARKEGADEIEVWGTSKGWDEHEHVLDEKTHIPALAQYDLGSAEVEWLWCEQ